MIPFNEDRSPKSESIVLDTLKGLLAGFDILTRYNEGQNRCIANTKVGKRCKLRNGHVEASKIQSLITCLSSLQETEHFGSELLPQRSIPFYKRFHRKDVRQLTENSKHAARVDTKATTGNVTVEGSNGERDRHPKKSKAPADTE